MKRVLIVGNLQHDNLEGSYTRAFRKLGAEVDAFNIRESLDRHCRFGKFGRVLSNFVSVDPWVTKANRSLLVHAMNFKPDLIVIFGNHPVRVGTLAQIKISCPAVTAIVWPDSMVNFPDSLANCLPMIDIGATHSKSGIPIMGGLGAGHSLCLPFAGDEKLHDLPDLADSSFEHEVTFIGGWRPEREEVLTRLSDFDLKIWGPEWDRRCKHNATITTAWQGRPLYGDEFAKATRASKINLNIIDQTNYPAANMRLYEIPASGGLQVCSQAPELETEFRDGEHLFYYDDPEKLPALIRDLLADEDRRAAVARAGRELVLSKHTYLARATALFELANKMT